MLLFHNVACDNNLKEGKEQKKVRRLKTISKVSYYNSHPFSSITKLLEQPPIECNIGLENITQI